MKYILRGLIILFITTCLLSCEELGNIEKKVFTAVETDYYDMDFDAEPRDAAGFQIFSEKVIPVDLTYVLEDAGLEPDRIESVHIIEAIVNLRETDSYKNFNLLRFVELTAYTDDQGETKIAWSDPIPEDKISLTLDVADSDVLPYFTEEEFILTAQGFLKERISTEMKLHAKVKFRVTVRVD